MRKSMLSVSVGLFSCMWLAAQNSEHSDHEIILSAYMDSYFAGYDNDPGQQEFQPFITVGARSNTFGVNVAQFGVRYQHERVRGNLILHFGDIPQATWSNDFNMIQEANVGVRLADGLWLDAGFFATHIGTESFLPKNNLLSHTMYLTYNEPFYQAGVKLTFDKWEDWELQLWGLNGYNSFVDNNGAKSIGILVSHDFSESTSLTYTNLYGRESEDGRALKQNRFYQNVYLNRNWNDIFYLKLGFDYGIQSNSDLNEPNDAATMFGGTITARYQIAPKFSTTSRVEIFNDEDGFISGTRLDVNGNETGIILTGFTFGTEYRPVENVYVRAETRLTRAADNLKIFVNDENYSNQRWEVLFTIGLQLEKVLGIQ